MNITVLVIIVVAVLLLLFVGVRIIKSCLPKIIIGLLILGVLGYLAYTYLTK
jgi:hypothetical protein